MERYKRQINLPEIGKIGQNKLSQAKILVVGAGGLGCAVLPYLVASGIGKIGVIDGDKVDISNLQRQVLYTEESVGKFKVDKAVKHLKKMNSEVIFNTYQEFLSAQNALNILAYYDIIVDATDNLPTRYLINDACVILDKPLVYGSVYRFEGQVSVFNYQNGPTYRCLFKKNHHKPVNCEEAGVLGTTVGIIGMLQANEVMKIILKTGDILSEKLLIYNTLKNSQNIIHFKKDETLKIDLEFFNRQHLVNHITNISFEKAIKSNMILIDVRELNEIPVIEAPSILKLPLSTLENQLHQLNKNKSYAVFCQHGIRSKMATQILKENQFKNISNITDGATTIYNIIQHAKKEKSIY